MRKDISAINAYALFREVAVLIALSGLAYLLFIILTHPTP